MSQKICCMNLSFKLTTSQIKTKNNLKKTQNYTGENKL